MGMGQFATGLIGELIVDGGGLDTRIAELLGNTRYWSTA